MGVREVVETAGLLPVGGSSNRSRVGFPVARSRRRRRRCLRGIRSSPVRPHPVGVAPRRRRQTGEGGVPLVNSLYRSPGLELRRLLQAAGLPTLCFKVAEQASGFAEGRWRGQARISLDDGCCRRRAVVLDQRSSGCGPGRWVFGDAFISSAWVSAYCDYSKPCGDRVPPDLVGKKVNWRLWWCLTAAGGSWFRRI